MAFRNSSRSGKPETFASVSERIYLQIQSLGLERHCISQKLGLAAQPEGWPTYDHLTMRAHERAGLIHIPTIATRVKLLILS